MTNLKEKVRPVFYPNKGKKNKIICYNYMKLTNKLLFLTAK